uniref:G_PROTEIN_RECEP_F1_2 domain-containing protein n=1 Tax=Caenorhabditis tropicalis TaxID=1561998 RepID=A0A1I7UZA2_9PELO
MPLLTFIQPSMLSEEQIYLEEWTNSSRLLFYSVISIAFFTLPVLLWSFCWIQWKKRKNPHLIPYLGAILVGNVVLLATLMGSVLMENTDVVYDTLPGPLVCKITAFLVNTSSCFIHWSWVAMYAERFCYIFFPLRFRNHSPCRTRLILLVILLISMCFQLWTPIFITGRRLDNQMDNIYCAEDPRYRGHTSLIVLLEVFTTFFLPLILTVFADISVLTWKTGVGIHLVSQEEIRTSDEARSHMRIVSSNSLRNSKTAIECNPSMPCLGDYYFVPEPS